MFHLNTLLRVNFIDCSSVVKTVIMSQELGQFSTGVFESYRTGH